MFAARVSMTSRRGRTRRKDAPGGRAEWYFTPLLGVELGSIDVPEFSSDVVLMTLSRIYGQSVVVQSVGQDLASRLTTTS